jgi:hypothetical protein
MKSARFVKVPRKAPTGVRGFDEITGGGLPRGRTRMGELRGADAAIARRK